MSHLRRLCALGAVTALTFAGLASVAGPAEATVDSRPVTIGASWLEGQLTGGVLHNDQYNFDDFGLSIDAGLSLAAVGGHGTTVSDISTAIAANIGDYIAYPGHTLAGSIAKAATFAGAAGDDPTSYGGEDLIADLEAQVAGSDPITGRIQDSYTPGPFESDFANVIGQAFAARVLTEEVSAKAGDVVTFLLAQQCAAGYFRLYFNPDASGSDQTCDGGAAGESTPDTDATALTVLQLLAIPEGDRSQDVNDAIDAAEGWLLTHQRADGSFGGGASTEAPNTNSTGLAGWALGVLGDDAAASKAAVWVRSHQADEPAGCSDALSGETGAIGYDDAAVTAGRTDGITTATQDQWRRTTAPTLPALQWAPAPTSALALSGPTDFVQADQTTTFQVSGGAPGDKVCVSGFGAARRIVVPASGSATVVLTAPSGTADRVATAALRSGSSASLVVQVLGATALVVKPRTDRVHRGDRVRVVVRGLVPGEQVTLRLRGHTVGTGVADPDARFVRRVRVGTKLGKARVVALGQFASIRRGRVVLHVVR